MRGDGAGGHTTITVADGFQNFGVLQLESVSAGYASDLVVAQGTLTNAAGGTILFNSGSGGERRLTGNLLNLGAFHANYGMTFDTTGGLYDNDGLFHIAASQTLTINGKNQVFNQNAGSLQIDGGMNLYSLVLNYNGGAFTGQNGVPYLVNCTLNLGPQATAPGFFVLTGSCQSLDGGTSSLGRPSGCGATAAAATPRLA